MIVYTFNGIIEYLKEGFGLMHSILKGAYD